MKTRFLFYLSFCAGLMMPVLIGTSCSKVKQAAAFDVTYNFPKVYFSYTARFLRLPEVTLYTGKLSINLDSILSANHIPSGIIASAYLSRLSMYITSPPEATFSWLQSVRMIGSVDSTFLQPTTLGSYTVTDPNVRNINLVLEKVNIKPLLFKNAYYLKILATPSGQIPPSTINMYLDSQIQLHIEPL